MHAWLFLHLQILNLSVSVVFAIETNDNMKQTDIPESSIFENYKKKLDKLDNSNQQKQD